MKYKKIYIMVLTALYIFFISIFSVKASTYSTYMQSANGPYTIEISGKYTSYRVENSAGQQTTLFKNWGQGKVIFSYVLGNRQTPTSQINQVTLMQTDGGEFVCDIGQSTQYVDNTTLNNTVTAICDVDLQNNNGITHVNFYRNTVAGTLLVIPGLFMEIITTEQPNVNVNVNQQEVTQAIQSSQAQVHQDIQQSNAIANDIKNAINEDVGNNYKQTPNQTDYNNYHNQEQSILGQISNTDTSAINIQNNNNANLFIWDTITKSLQSHAKVMALMISILSIGIIKLILNR